MWLGTSPRKTSYVSELEEQDAKARRRGVAPHNQKKMSGEYKNELIYKATNNTLVNVSAGPGETQ